MDEKLSELLQIWKAYPGDGSIAAALTAAVQEELEEGNEVLLKVFPTAIPKGITADNVKQFGEILPDTILQFHLWPPELAKASGRAPLEFTVNHHRRFLGFGNIALGQIAFFEASEVVSMESQALPR